MNTSPNFTASQLRLAADILETGHPWERLSNGYTWIKAEVTPIVAIANGDKIRPILATPPDNRPLHNPDNLTAEQVGVGYRLTVEGESPCAEAECYLHEGGWRHREKEMKNEPYLSKMTYRLPLSVPWHDAPEIKDPYAELKAAHAAGKVIESFNRERGIWQDCPSPVFEGGTDYRIKPEEPFQLPPPPPGMKWHREDGWKKGDLPQGMRPLVLNEKRQDTDDVRNRDGWLSFSAEKKEWPSSGGPNEEADFCSFHSRTTRPLTFTHAGKTWTYHRPGDPMPCDGRRRVQVVMVNGHVSPDFNGRDWDWAAEYITSNPIVGWRYAEPVTQEVELGPEDVLPGSEFRFNSSLPGVSWTRLGANVNGVILHTPGQELNSKKNIIRTIAWNEMSDMQINRSIPLTGKWNPDAWEPCHKTIQQNP